MTISHLSLVNQKLAYAKAIIRNLEDLGSEASATPKLNRQALADAAVFHLVSAFHFYLRELADKQAIRNLSAVNSTHNLIDTLQQAEKTSSESVELHTLSQTADSWLSQLLGYYERIFKSPEKPKEKKSFGQENLIELVELTEACDQLSIELTADILNSWLHNFRDLIIRQRETSAEF